MRNRSLLAAILAIVSAVLPAAPLRAGDIKYPSDGSGIAATIPDDWKTVEDTDGTLRCTSADGEFYFELLPGRMIDVEKIDLGTAAAGLAEHAGLTDIRTDDGGEKTNPNGVKIAGRIVHGRKGETEYVGVVSILTPAAGEKCAFQCYGTKTVLLIHSKEMAHITASFRAAK